MFLHRASIVPKANGAYYPCPPHAVLPTPSFLLPHLRQQGNFSVFNNDTYFLARTPPRVKNVPPTFPNVGGTKKFANHVLPPRPFTTVAPPWRSVVIIHSSRIIISSLKLLYFWMLLFVVTTKLRTSTSLFAGYFCLYFARIAGCLCIYAINEYNALLRIVRLMLGSCRGSRMPRRHTE